MFFHIQIKIQKYTNAICQIFRKTARCLARSAASTIEHDGIEHAGYIALLMMLGIIPFFLFLFALLRIISEIYFFEHIQTFILKVLPNLLLNNQLSSFVSPLNFISPFKNRIFEFYEEPPQSFWTFAFISIAWTASAIIEGMRTIFNKAYRVDNPPRYILRRLFSIIEFLIIEGIAMALLLLFIVVPIIFDTLYHSVESMLSSYKLLNNIIFILDYTENIRIASVLIIAFIAIAGIYKFLPNTKHSFTWHCPGALVAIAGLVLFAYSFKLYLQIFKQINFIYGSITSIMIALLYLYASSLILIYGAEFNYQWDQEKINKTSLPPHLDPML